MKDIDALKDYIRKLASTTASMSDQPSSDLEVTTTLNSVSGFTENFFSDFHTDYAENYSLDYLDLSDEPSIFANCYSHYNPNIIFSGTIIECIFLSIVLYMMYFFAFKAKFKPSSNIWLFCGSFIIVLWICVKLVQDYIEFSSKCLITENLVLFCSLFGSSLNVGMCIDRCRAVYSHMTNGGMKPTRICLYICISASICLLIVTANSIEMVSQEVDVYNNTFLGCFQSASAYAQSVKSILKVIVNGMFVIIVVTSTILTVKKILKTSLRKKVFICVNVVMVTMPITFIWITSICYTIWEIMRRMFCPKLPTGNIFIYLTSLPMLIMLFIYMFTGENLKKTFNIESKAHSMSLTSVSCCNFSLGLDLKRHSRVSSDTTSSKTESTTLKTPSV